MLFIYNIGFWSPARESTRLPLSLRLLGAAGLDAGQVTAATPHVLHQDLAEPVIHPHLAAQRETNSWY